MRKKRVLVLLLSTGAALLLACCVAVLAHKADWRYVAWDWVSHLGTRGALSEASEDSLQLVEVSLDALLQDPRTQCDQSLLLINSAHPLQEDFVPEVEEYGQSGVQMNACLLSPYAALSGEVYARYGEPLYIISSFRTAQEQQTIAQEKSEDIAAGVGESEHQAGLALDVYVQGYGGSSFLKTPVGQFVNSEGWRYGFIIRYPYYGTEETGISFEPWHIRYVGQPHAELITSNRWTLEEYYEQLQSGVYYSYENYCFSRQEGESFRIPADFEACVLSEDNQGAWILTFQMD